MQSQKHPKRRIPGAAGIFTIAPILCLLTLAGCDLFNSTLDNEITLGPNGTGWLGKHEKSPWGLKNETVRYLMSKAMADHKSPAQIIDELMNKELATAV